MSRPLGVHLTDAQKAAIRAALAAGEPIDAIARRLGHSRNTVKAYRDGAAIQAAPAEDTPQYRAIVAQVIADLTARGMLGGGLAPGERVETPAETRAEPEPPPRLCVEDEGRPERVAVVSDLHIPFLCVRAWRCFLQAMEDYKPDLTVFLGDLFECYSASKHPKAPDMLPYLQDEFDAAQDRWAEARRISGRKKVVWGNHDERIERIQADNPALFRLRGMALERLAEMPAEWEYHANQTRIEIGPLSLLHGDIRGRGSGGVHVAATMLKVLRTSCLYGHYHRFQTHLESGAKGVVQGSFANGHMVDTRRMTWITSPNWQQGFSTVEFDHDANLFAVEQHLIINGVCRFRGKTYAG